MRLISCSSQLLVLLLGVQSAFASDLAREQRMAEQLVDAILDGEAVYLKSASHDFFNIYTESFEDNARGGVIVLHGRGFNPDWEDVVKPLRVGLAEAGWNTLSMQMPVLSREATYDDYLPVLHEAFPRIEAGIEYLKKQGNQNITIIAHSCSVHMVMAWVDAGRFRDVDAYVGIGMGAIDYGQSMLKPFPLNQLKIPVLDIFGADEYPAVIGGADERWRLIQIAGHKKSAQRIVKDADHYFTDQGDALLQAVLEWMKLL